MTRREARERERREEAARTGPFPTVPSDFPPITGQFPTVTGQFPAITPEQLAEVGPLEPAPVTAEQPIFDVRTMAHPVAQDERDQDAFWGSLQTAEEPEPREAEPPRDAGRGHPHAWSSLEYPTEDRGGRGRGGKGQPGGGTPKRRRRWLTVTIVLVVILALIGGGGFYAWSTFQPQIEKLLSLGGPNDYTGSGTTPVTVTINAGDGGSAIASTLQKAGVVKTSEAFYDLLLQTKPDPVFQPGVFKLKKQMSAKSALAALQNPANRLEHTVVIPEGTREKDILASVSKATGVSVADLTAAAADPRAYGVPAQAKTLEGFLFPATYSFDPGMSAKSIITTMVNRTFQALDDAGVPTASRWNVVVLASIVQAEAGPNPADLGKIARVFDNRISQGMLLQSDATVAYGAGVKTVFTTDAQRADAGNLYNTYVHAGLTPGPISNPGEAAMSAALHPTAGGWLYFVTVNLKTGETVFSNTLSEQQAAEQRLHDWCAESANSAYC